MIEAMIFAALCSVILTAIVWVYDCIESSIHRLQQHDFVHNAKSQDTQSRTQTFGTLMMPKVGRISRSPQGVSK